MSSETIVSLLASIVSVAISVGSGFFSMKAIKQQAAQERNKLRTALWERRYPLYEATLNFAVHVGHVGVHNCLNTTEYIAFRRATRDALILCGPDVADYIAEIVKQAGEMSIASEALNHPLGRMEMPDGRSASTAGTEAVTWIVNQAAVKGGCTEAFRKSLDLSDI